MPWIDPTLALMLPRHTHVATPRGLFWTSGCCVLPLCHGCMGIVKDEFASPMQDTSLVEHPYPFYFLLRCTSKAPNQNRQLVCLREEAAYALTFLLSMFPFPSRDVYTACLPSRTGIISRSNAPGLVLVVLAPRPKTFLGCFKTQRIETFAWESAVVAYSRVPCVCG